jgi:septum formation protein
MLGLTFETVPADIDEAYRPGEDAGEHAERLAREKALGVAASRPGSLVVGSDTVVVVGGVVLGKPQSAEQAIDMLLRLQGREHSVATGVAVARNTAVASAVEKVTVRFRAFGRETAGAYVATGEPLDKAGAYGIQGYGAALVERIDGDFFAVMGLPVCRLLQIMASMGFRYDFRSLKPQ